MLSSQRLPATGLLNLARLQTARANAQALRSAAHLRFHGVQIHIPAPLGDVVRVRNVVPKLRTLAANIANLCHVFSKRRFPLRGCRRKYRGLRTAGLSTNGPCPASSSAGSAPHPHAESPVYPGIPDATIAASAPSATFALFSASCGSDMLLRIRPDRIGRQPRFQPPGVFTNRKGDSSARYRC
jgi:hypothetical protein